MMSTTSTTPLTSRCLAVILSTVVTSLTLVVPVAAHGEILGDPAASHYVEELLDTFGIPLLVIGAAAILGVLVAQLVVAWPRLSAVAERDDEVHLK